MLRIGKQTPVPSRVITFKEVDINVPFDLGTNGIRALPSGAGKRYCRVSVLSFRICLTRIRDQRLQRLFRDAIFFVFFSNVL